MKKIILICLSIASVYGYGQTFQKTLYSTGEDLNHFNIEQTSDGNYIIGGDYFNSAGAAKYYVSKIDPLGNTLWSTNIDILSDGRLLDVAEDNDGNIILTGYRTTSGVSELYVAQLDNSGLLLNDVVIDNFPNSAGTNIIYSASTDTYIVGGFKSSNFSWSLNSNEAILLELDKGLNLMWSQKLVGTTDTYSSINDIIETPTGYFVTGSIAFDTGAPNYFTFQGVMAIFVDFGGSLTADLSFESTNARHTGVSAFYDSSTDEIYMVSNSSYYHNPIITSIGSVSGGPILNSSFMIRLDPTFGQYNAAAFKIAEDPNAPNEVILCGYFRTPKNGSGTWYMNIDKSGTTLNNVMLYNAPVGSFSQHGGGLFSTFVSEHPYIFNQEIMTLRHDMQGIVFLAPREFNNNYAVDLISTPNYTSALDCESLDTARSIPVPHNSINCLSNLQGFSSLQPMHVNTQRRLRELITCEYNPDLRLKSTTTSSVNTGVEVYPNPSTDYFNVKINAELYSQIIVRDLTGRIVKEITLTNEENKILLDLSGESTGIYFVTALGGSDQKTIKISKQ